MLSSRAGGARKRLAWAVAAGAPATKPLCQHCRSNTRAAQAPSRHSSTTTEEGGTTQHNHRTATTAQHTQTARHHTDTSMTTAQHTYVSGGVQSRAVPGAVAHTRSPDRSGRGLCCVRTTTKCLLGARALWPILWQGHSGSCARANTRHVSALHAACGRYTPTNNGTGSMALQVEQKELLWRRGGGAQREWRVSVPMAGSRPSTPPRVSPALCALHPPAIPPNLNIGITPCDWVVRGQARGCGARQRHRHSTRGGQTHHALAPVSVTYLRPMRQARHLPETPRERKRAQIQRDVRGRSSQRVRGHSRTLDAGGVPRPQGGSPGVCLLRGRINPMHPTRTVA